MAGADEKSPADSVRTITEADGVLGREARVERLELRPAQVVAAEPDGGEYGETHNAQGRKTPGAQTEQAAPKPFQLLPPNHSQPQRSVDIQGSDTRPRSL